MSAKSILLNGSLLLRPAIVPVNCDEECKIKLPVAPEANVTFTDEGPNNSACCVPVRVVLIVGVVVVAFTFDWRSAPAAERSVALPAKSWIAVGDGRMSPITRRSEVPRLDWTVYSNAKACVPEPLA